MKALKVVGAVLGLLLALAAGAAAYLVATLDDRLEAALARLALEKQRRLVVGELEILSLWPTAAVRLGKASLSERGSEEPFATLAGARVSVATMSLLSDRVLADAIEIHGLRATLVRHPDGSLNIADLLAADPQRKPLQAAIAGIRLTDARLAWRDERGGGSGEAILTLATGPVTLDGGAFQVDNATLTADVGDTALLAAASGLAGSGQALDVSGLALGVETPLGDGRLRVGLGSSLAADLTRSTLTLADIGGQVDIDHPRLPAGPLHLPVAADFKADLAARTAEAKLATRLDGSPVDARIRLTHLSPPAVDFQVDIGRFDADRYLGADKEGSGGGVPGIPGIDLSGTIRVGELRLANMTARNARVEVANGRLRVAAAR